jgi:HK97 family phage portal protein
MSEAISQYLKRVIEERARVLASAPVKKGVGPLVDDSRLYRSLRSYLSSGDNMEVTDPYEKSVWVFASINAIAQNISRVPFYIYEEKTENLKTVVQEGKLPDLFMNPNPYMIGSTLIFATVIFMELFGESMWILEGRKNITEIPTEIWCVSPQRFEPVIGADKKFHGYWDYKAGEEKIRLAPHQILHFKYFNPYDDIRGLSGIEASRLGVEQDYFAGKYNKQFFKDGVSLSGMIQAPDFLTDEQYKRLKDQFEEKHAGYGNAHKVGVIEGGAEFVEAKMMSQRDMEFSVLKRVIRGEILAAFKTNEVVLGNYENIQSYEGIKNAHESFWKETLLPKMIYIEDLLWAQFFSKIDGGKFWAGFDTSAIEALREDFGNKVEMAKTLNEIGYPINMINKRLDMGFEEVPWGNTWFVKMGMVPVEFALQGPPETEEPSSGKPGTEPGKPPDEPEDEEEPATEPNPDKTMTNRDDVAWASFISREVPVENYFKSKIKRFLYEQRKRVLANISGSKEFFNEVEERTALTSLLQNLYVVASQTGKELLKEEILMDEIDYKEVDDLVSERITFSSTTIINTLKNSISKILQDVEGIPAQSDRIRLLYNKTDNTVSRIARTESSAIINGVRFILMQKQGIRYHKWISKSENGRHSQLHGKIVKIGESFSKDFTLRYPTDKKAPVGEVINCLCYCVPVIKAKEY